MRYKLSEMVLRPTSVLAEAPGLLWEASAGTASYDEARQALRITGTVDLATYLNALSAEKWRRYCELDEFYVRLELSGDPCRVMGTAVGSHGPDIIVEPHPIVVFEGSEEPVSFEAKVPLFGAELAGVRIESEGTTLLHSGAYFCEVDESRPRPVELALCTTTFKNESYIVSNIEAVCDQVLGCEDPIASHFRMFVVDNGRTLDVDALSGGGIEVIPNPNVGGAGGFARGMMAALDWEATHVLLMDDDVTVLPESLKRTFALLSLVSDEYRDAFLNGAMLKMQAPGEFFEDVSRVTPTGVYRSIKPHGLPVDVPRNAAHIEAFDVELDRTYGAWWYSCIPTSAIRRNGLPLPVFVRCDDVEFGMRCDPTYMTMDGICVWHSMFEGRFRASVDEYMYVRNLLIANAVDDLGIDAAVLMRFSRTFGIYLRAMSYDICDLMLDGVADFLKGPAFLEHVNGARLFASVAARNERLQDVGELSGEDAAAVAAAPADPAYLDDRKRYPMVYKALEFVMPDTHMLPDALRTDAPAAVYYARGAYPLRRTLGHTTLVSYDTGGSRAHVRHMDLARWEGLRRRYRRVMRAYRDRGDEARREWADAAPLLTSREFWEGYLEEQAEA